MTKSEGTADNEANEGNEEEAGQKGTKKRGRTVYFEVSMIMQLPMIEDGKVVKENGKAVTDAHIVSQVIEVKTPLDQEVAQAEFKENIKGLAKLLPSAKQNKDGTYDIKGQSISISDNIAIQGPFYRVKGTASSEKSVSVTVPAKDFKHTGNIWAAEFQGWQVMAHGLKSFIIEKADKKTEFDADELVFLIFDEPTEATKAKAKAAGRTSPLRPRFGGDRPTVYRSALENAEVDTAVGAAS
jgi:hypothetical protein